MATTARACALLAMVLALSAVCQARGTVVYPPPYPPPPRMPPSPASPASPRLKENDHLWICALKYEQDRVPWSGKGCGSEDAKEAFNDLVEVVHPVSETLSVNKSMSIIPDGCCLQTALLDTDRSDDLDSPGLGFMRSINSGGIFRWTRLNRVCGPKTAIIVIVGWNMYAPPAYQLYGCNPGPAGLTLPHLCRC